MSSGHVGEEAFAAAEVVEARNGKKHSRRGTGKDEVPGQRAGPEHHGANAADHAGDRVQAVEDAEPIRHDAGRNRRPATCTSAPEWQKPGAWETSRYWTARADSHIPGPRVARKSTRISAGTTTIASDLGTTPNQSIMGMNNREDDRQVQQLTEHRRKRQNQAGEVDLAEHGV